MANIAKLLTEHIEIWTAADTVKKSGRGRASGNAGSVYGVKKLRELILELAVRGKLVPQDANDEPASELLKRIQAEKAKLVAEGKIKKEKPLSPISEDEKPFELPNEWEWTNLLIASVINPRNYASDEIEASFVPMTLIGSAFNDKHQDEKRLWKEIKQGFTHFAEGDIGVAKITPCFENSKACVFENLENGLGAGTTELHVIRPVMNTLSPRYVLAYLKSPRFLKLGESKMTGTAGQKRLPKYFVETNPFPLPPLAEQHRIVAKVDELMALCDQLEQQHSNAQEVHETLVSQLLATLTQSQNAAEFNANWQRIYAYFDVLFTTEASIDNLKQTLLQLAVMGKLVPQDPNDEPASKLLKRIQAEKAKLIAEGKLKKEKPLAPINEDEKPFELPQGWQWVHLPDVTDYKVGKTPSTKSSIYWTNDNNGYHWVSIADLNHDGVVSETTKKVTYEALKEVFRAEPVDVGTILMSFKLTLGKISILEVPAFHNEAIISIYPSRAIDKKYLFKILPARANEGDSKSAIKGNTLNSESIAALLLPLPPLAEQHRIVAKVNALMAYCDQLKTLIQQANQQQQKLADVLVVQSLT